MEKHIQSAIRDKMRSKGWLVIKLVVTSMFGIPDLLCIRAGQFVFIEVKQPGKKPTPLQKTIHERLVSHGAKVLTAVSVADIEHLL